MSETISLFVTGEIVMFTHGVYSDYGVNGLFVVQKDFDAQEELFAWAKNTNRKISSGGVVRADYGNEQMDYLGWLNAGGFLKELDRRELHTGDYGDTFLDCFSH